jgi:hypothetical protein
MSYKQSHRLSITAVGNYFGLRSTDKLIDLDNIGGKGIVSWELEPLRDWKPQLSVEGGYNLQVNRLMPSRSSGKYLRPPPPRARHHVTLCVLPPEGHIAAAHQPEP